MDLPENTRKELAKVAADVGVNTSRMHIFLCTSGTCASKENGESAWDALKRELKKRSPELSKAHIYRTKADCLRMCMGGPIAVVYPQGKWFQGVTADQVPGLVEYLESGSTEPHPLQFVERKLTQD
ncbi:MAG: (2Fe-2S) ferredoxin domain-containing protein [Deltaproteobacteria bacterium]|nr:(2Fe-2S) ferredoxin domain-containing protein [Deltaproteobacteria bacterium]